MADKSISLGNLTTYNDKIKATYQTKTDNNLTTTDKTIAGAINENKTQLDNIAADLNGYKFVDAPSESEKDLYMQEFDTGMIQTKDDSRLNGEDKNLVNVINSTKASIDNHIANHPSGGDQSTVIKNINDFYNSSKAGKKIVMLGDSTVISGAGGGAVNERFSKYQIAGQCLDGCVVQNNGAIGKTLNGWVNNEMAGVIANSSSVDLYIFCLGINDLMNLNRTEEQISSDFKIAIDGLLSGTNSYILLRLPCINQSKPEWQQILRRIYMSYIGYNQRIDVIDIPLLTAFETNYNIFLSDNVHPTTNGYYMIVDEMVGRICRLNTNYLDSEKITLFKGYVLDINGKNLTIISSNNFLKLEQIGTLYINNIPYQYSNLIKVDINKYELTLINDYQGIIGIARIFGNAIDKISNASNIAITDWYTTGAPKERLWFSIPIPAEIVRTSSLKLNVTCSGFGFGNGILRLTSILRQSPTDTINQQFGTADTKQASTDNNIRINNYYLQSSVSDDGLKQYVICSLDIIGVTNYDNARLGNFKIKINDVDVVLNNFNFVNCGAPIKATTPILMTHDSLIQLLIKLGMVEKDTYKLLSNTLTPPIETVNVESVNLNKQSTVISIGGTETLIATISPANATNKTVTWSSSNNSIATVNNGVVSGISNGECVITATTVDGNKISTCTVLVSTSTIPVTSVGLDKTTYTFKVDEVVQLNASIQPSNATNQAVTWTSSDETKATVVNGLVTAKMVGNCVITVTTQDGNKTASCNLTINAKDIVTPDEIVTNGLILNLDAIGNEGNISSWEDKTGNYPSITLTNFAFNSSDGWTGTTLKLAKASTSSKTKINSNISIPNISELEGITLELNYKCDITRATANMKTQIVTMPCDIRISENTTAIDSLYFENYTNMKVGLLPTVDAKGGCRSIIVVFNTKSGSHTVYLDGVSTLTGTGSINSTNLAKVALTIKEALGFSFEIGSIRLYNRMLSADEVLKNNNYEKKLNR